MPDLGSGRAAIDVAIARVRVAQRGTRQAAQGLAKARDALTGVMYLRMRTAEDLDSAVRALRAALDEGGDVDLIVLTTTDHSPSGAQTERTP